MAPTVADVLVDGLLRSGVTRVFVACHSMTGLEAAAERRGLGLVDAGTPAMAGLMAAVTAEMSEAPGVALIADPALTGVAAALGHAMSSRAPLIVVGPGSAPSVGVAFKGGAELTTKSAAHGTAHALQLALRAPRGPVHLALDPDIANRPAVPIKTTVRPAPPPPPDRQELDDAARRLGGASHPVLVVGLECRGGDVAKWLRPLAETLPAPVLVTPRARGVLPDPHPLNLGSVSEGSALLAQADLVVAVGVDVSESVPQTWSPTVPVLHLGATASARAGWMPADELVGDIALIIEELAPRLREQSRADWDIAELDRLRRQVVAARRSDRGLARVVAMARDVAPARTIAAADGGQCAAAVLAAWQAVSPSELLVPDEGRAAAFALPAALAARLERPACRALAFTDTAGIAQADGVLDAMARLKAPVVAIALGAATGAPLPVARRLGLTVIPALTESALVRALSGALAGSAPSLIDTRGGQAWSPPV
jgi:acetolactate synthase I/II/III large subunit